MPDNPNPNLNPKHWYVQSFKPEEDVDDDSLGDEGSDPELFIAQIEGDHATLDDYYSLVEDRPVKFTPDQAGYQEKPKFKQVCRSCVHFFRCDATGGRVCEIVRKLDDSNIQPHGWCKFWTDDYRNFPLLNKEP